MPVRRFRNVVCFVFAAAALAALGAAPPAGAQAGGICPDLCRDEPDCPQGEICYPPTQQCQPPCAIACLVPDPVCGDDGVTYPCGVADAHCNGAEVVHEGPCDDDCVCPDVWAPVCGVDGVTYGNACEARCAGVDVLHDGPCHEQPCGGNADCPRGEICFPPTDRCQPPCAVQCLPPGTPVCGDDGTTYPCGPLDAHCSGAEVVHEGSCEQPCVCPHVYAPVCGIDGQTYANACFAQCAGVEVLHDGECPPAPECGSNQDCPQGEICFPPTLRCQPQCSVDCFTAAPVCGSDGQTYGCGPSDAHCAGATVVHDGPCGGCQTDQDCGFGRVCQGGECQEPCACPRIYAPVCGVDGQTYANPCVAQCAGVDVAHDGECQDVCRVDDDCSPGEACVDGACEPCFCPLVWDPVCGVDGVTYGNTCEARCAHVDIAHAGECGVGCGTDEDCGVGGICVAGRCESCVCPNVWAPVCGVDGATYGNACEARCAHVEIRHDGECGDPCRQDVHCPPGEVCQGGECTACVCPDVWAPVCGVDGVTYGNACEARCAHVDVLHDGECVPPACFEDSDEDGVPDAEDNCVRQPNGPLGGPNDQSDADGDGYGDVCDCDFTGDGVCDIGDFLVFLSDFVAGSDSGAGTDMTADGLVSIDDFRWFLSGFVWGAPGPSAQAP